jgi:hypothetical protein
MIQLSNKHTQNMAKEWANQKEEAAYVFVYVCVCVCVRE